MRKLRKAKALASFATLAIVASLLVPLFSQPALAQATTGSIRGTVTDQTGAIVPEATIVAKNQATGTETAPFKTTGDGIFTIPNLIPGPYTLTVEAANFKRAVFTDIDVRTGQDVTIDAALQPGGLTETVTIAAGSEEVVNRETAQVTTNFESRKVAELPSNGAGNGIDTLALLAPGVVPGVAGNSNGTTLSVNGNRSRSNNFTIDGQDNNDLSVAGPAFFVNNQDVVEDFQIITNNFSAQYGRNQGAIVNVVTKSGTNDFHGTAFWFHRDQKNFDSLTNIEKRGGNEEPPFLLNNTYGGTFGGPIWRDRAFFFGSYQGVKERSSGAALLGTTLAIVPEEFDRLKSTFAGNSAIAVLADFGAFAITDFGTVGLRSDVGGQTGTFTFRGQQFRVGGPFDIIALPINPALPCAAVDAQGNPTNNANCAVFQAALPERLASFPNDEDEFTLRGDVKLTDRDKVWGSFFYEDAVSGNGLADAGGNGFTGDVVGPNRKFGVTWDRQISTTGLNSAFFSYSSLLVDFGGGCEGQKGCIPGSADIANTFTNINFGGVRSPLTGRGLQTVGGATNLPQGRFVKIYQFSDTYQTTRGKHTMMVGADIRRLINETTVIFNFQGAFTAFTPARLVQNNPGSVTFAAGEPTINFNETDQFYFFQDDWKVKDNLTLNLGMRYENTGQPVNALHDLTLERESNTQEAFFRLNIPIESRIVPKFSTDKNNFAPRLGFAWTPRFGGDGFIGRMLGEDATVIRGGYGIAYDPAFYNILIFLSTGTPTVFSNTLSNPATPSATTPILFPIPDSNPIASSVQAFADSNGLIARNILDPRLLSQSVLPGDFHSPYSQQWQFGIQRQINRNNVAEVRYLGTHGISLFQNRDANPRIDRLVNGFTTPAVSVGGTVVRPALTFPGFPSLVPAGISPVACVENPATRDLEAACNGRILAGRGIVTETGNHGQSIYHSLQTRYNGRLWNQFTMGSSYTWSKVLDTASEVIGLTTAGSLSQHPFDIVDSERSYAVFDRRHVFSLNGIWDLPFFKEQKGILGHAFGGWQINSVYLLSSGRRWTLTNGFNNNLNAIGIPVYSQQVTADRMRPFFGNRNAPRDTVAITGIDVLLTLSGGASIFGWPTAGVSPTTDLYLVNDLNNGRVTRVSKDAVRYIVNGPGSAVLFGTPHGDVPRNDEIGPKTNQLNVAFFKNTRVTERVNIQFRAEMFNFLNHPNPGYGTFAGGNVPPSRTVINAGVPGFAFNDHQDIEFARRVIQLGLRVVF